MTLAIDLPHVLLVRVEARAQERGMALTEYVAKLIEEALPAEPNARAVSLLKAWEAESSASCFARARRVASCDSMRS
jgi:macrodomain Ter protein organizer (MatP/YcbG family)